MFVGRCLVLLGVWIGCVLAVASQQEVDDPLEECIPASSNASSAFRDFCTCTAGSPCIAELACSGLTEFYVGDETFPNVDCLVIVDSSFTHIGSAHLAQFPRVHYLSINNTKLETVEDDSLSVTNLPRLLDVVLVNNNLSSFPQISHPKVSFVDMTRNQISSVDSTTFAGLPALNILYMCENKISELRGSVFYENCRLTFVDFSDNPLKEIDENVFDGASVETLHLSRTQVSRIPTSRLFRERIRSISLDGVGNFRTFDALSTNPAENYSNVMYPFLQEVRFPYHAHCCQLKSLKIKYRGVLDKNRTCVDGTVAVAMASFVGFVPFQPTLITPTPTTLAPTTLPSSSVVCVNRTSQECVEYSAVDESAITLLSSTMFCSSVNACAIDCLRIQGVCPGACATPTTNPGGFGSGDGGDIAPSAPQVLCVENGIAPSHTIASSSVPVSVAPSATIVVTTTVVEQTLCASSCVVATPTATPTSDNLPCTSVATVEAVCTGMPLVAPPPTTPPPPDLCSSSYCQVTYEGDSTKKSACSICSTLQCVSFFDDCSIFLGEECDCWELRHQCCSQTRKKRVAASSGSPALAPHLAFSWEGDRVRRDITGASNCSLNEDDVFLVHDENFTAPLECRRRLPPPTTPIDTSTAPVLVPACIRLRALPIDAPIVQEICPVVCFPTETAFNPCDNLLGETDALRGAIWTVVILAFLGNGLVFLVFIGYSVFIRRTKQELFVIHFLYFNLAVADTLMGVYLLIIASQDAATRGEFFKSDVVWRLGSACELAGFMAMTSTVVSVYILLVITLERTYTIVRVLKHKKLNKRRALVTMLVGWFLGAFIAALPLFYFSDYNSVAICLPFDVAEPQDLFYVVTLLLGTGVAFVVIAVCYAIILQQIMCSRRKSRPYLETKRRLAGEIKVTVRIFILIFTNLVCWFPIALIGLSAAFGYNLVSDLEFARWAIVFIFPINACINPFLYSLTTRAFRDNFVLLLSKCGFFKKKAQVIRNAQVGLTPTWTSRNSDHSGVMHVRNTVVMRLRTLSISSQSSVTNLFARINQRRPSSTMSQTSSEESNHIAMLNARRRSSALSNDSAREMLGRSRSDSTFSGESDEAAITIMNTGFRTSSPEGARPSSSVYDRPADARSRVKVSASSLAALPEEVEVPMEVIGDEHIVKLNPAFRADEEEEEEGDGEEGGEEVTEWEDGTNLRDSGMVEGSENDSGEVEASITPPPPAYQLNMVEENS